MSQEGGVLTRDMDFDGIGDQTAIVQIDGDLAADEIEDRGTVAAFRGRISLEFWAFRKFRGDRVERVEKGGLEGVVVGELGMLAIEEANVDGVEVLPSGEVVRLHKGVDCLERWNQGFLNETER